MKTIYGIITLFALAGCLICPVWTIVEFLIYLVKDKEFNWWSIWTLIICVVSLFVTGILAEKPGDDAISYKRSRFQKRLDYIQKKKSEENNKN